MILWSSWGLLIRFPLGDPAAHAISPCRPGQAAYERLDPSASPAINSSIQSMNTRSFALTCRVGG